MTKSAGPQLQEISRRIIQCRKCPRLRNHCAEIARTKRKAYATEEYWGKPVPGFGDPKAALLVVGLAPAAHGANRTGRVFTGDRSGQWLYGALHRFGFSNLEESKHHSDSLRLKNAYISCVARCAPPGNKPTSDEITACLPHLSSELAALRNIRVFLALGRIAYEGLWLTLKPEMKKPAFAHGMRALLPDGRLILTSYHPSQQNTFTGRLTEAMLDSVFQAARDFLHNGD